MKERKISADWNIAATHWLTAGFAIPFILALVLGFPLAIALKGDIQMLGIALIILNILSMWLGVIYSSKYLAKTYIIKNANKIINLATIYLAVIGGGFRLYTFIQTSVLPYEYIGFVVALIVFYFASKKYVKNNA